MKKNYLFLLALALCNISIHAAEGPQSLTTGIVIGSGGFPHFNPQGSKTGSFVSYRLSSKTYSVHNGLSFQTADSVNYIYSTGRGGLIDPDRPNYDESILFDDAVTYYYNPQSGIYDNKLYRRQTFDNQNKILSLRYSIWHNMTQAWKDSARYLYSYLPGTNKIDESLFQLWVGGTWAHDVPSVLTYNGNNVVNINSNAYNASYTYDANNNITSIIDKKANHSSGILYLNERKSYTYNANNDVSTYMLEKWDEISATWVKQQYFEYTYKGRNVTESLEYKWNSNWVLYSKHNFTYDLLNNKIAEITQLWNASTGIFSNYTSELCVYNINNLIESITISSWDAASASWKHQANNTQTRYYYEYYAPTAITTATLSTGTIALYPIPANNFLYISLNLDKPQNVVYSIQNMNGAIVKQWEEVTNSNNTSKIAVSDLPAGSYMVYARTQATAYSNKLTIVK